MRFSFNSAPKGENNEDTAAGQAQEVADLARIDEEKAEDKASRQEQKARDADELRSSVQ